MSKTLVVVMAACALATASVFAAPRALSSAEMDGVAAGQQSAAIASDVLSALFAIPAEADVESAQDASLLKANRVSASGEESIAVLAENGSSVAAAGAVATNDGLAINGDRNLALKQDGNIAVGFAAAGQCNIVTDMDNAENAILATDGAQVRATNVENNRVSGGSALVVGDCNETTVTTDNGAVIGIIAAGAAGVVAGEAEVCGSFNLTKVDIDIRARIDNSFNNTKNEMQICGENKLSAIVNANTLGSANVGANLNVTTATAKVSTDQEGASLAQVSIPFISGNAIAATVQSQVVTNNVIVAGLGAIIL